MENKKPIYSVGGQALINGIMMSGPLKTAISVRKLNGEIITTDLDIKRNTKFSKIPIIRGCVSYVQSMKIGMDALMYSAEVSMLEEDDNKEEINEIDDTENSFKTENIIKDELKEKITEKISQNNIQEDENVTEEKTEIKNSSSNKKEEEEKNNGKIVAAIGGVIGTILGVALSICLFMWLPSTLYNILPFPNTENMLTRSVFEGLFKLIIMIGYMAVISYMPDIRKVFQYHGAEHKTIFCYEHGKELTIENVKEETRFHPRCGTSFIILAIIVGIVISLFIPVTNPFLRTIIKLSLLPITVGLSYELIKICGKHDNIITKILSAPGCWIQRITTKEPTDDIIEVAIEALNAALK